MIAKYRGAALAAALLAAAPAAAVTNVHISAVGLYTPGSVVVTKPSGTVTDYAGPALFTLTVDGGAPFDVLGFCIDLFHSINVGIGYQAATSLDYVRSPFVTDANGTTLTTAQRSQIGGLASLGFGIAGSTDPDKAAKLAAIQQAIWTIEYPTLTFDGSGGLAGQQAYANAFVAAAPGLTGVARTIYAGDSVTQAFLVAGVPEPASWALMVAGFGLVGFASRRRHGPATVAA